MSTIRTYISQLESAYRDQVFLLLLIRLAWLLVASVLVLVVLDAGFALPAEVRLALDGLALVLLVACVAWSVRQAYRSRAFANMLVRLVEEGHPELQNSLTNALDFEERLETPDARFSRDLMTREIANATEQVTGIGDFSALTPPTLKREAWALGALTVLGMASAVILPAVFLAVLPRYILPFGDHPPYSTIQLALAPGNTTIDFGDNLKIDVTASGRLPKNVALVLLDDAGREAAAIDMHDAGEGAFFQSLENLQSPVTYFARAGRARTRKYRIQVNTVPRIEDAVVTYTYPAYTHLDPRTTVLSEPVLQGYQETLVTMSLRSNRPLRGGRVTVNGQLYACTPGSEPNIVEASFPLREPGTFRANIEDVDGLTNEEGLQGKIEIIPDNGPEITIANPGMDSFAVPDAKIKILIDASDDLGIARVAFFRRHNDSDDARKFLYEDEGRTSFVTATDTLDLKDLGVKPGDTIDYYATATDSRPDAPQTATSEQFRLKIVSFEEYREYAQSQMTAQDLREKYEAIQEEMEALADRQRALKETIDALQRKLAEEGALSEEEQAALAAAEQAQSALAEEAADLAKRLEEMADRPAVFDIENEYKDALRDFAGRLAEANEKMNQAREEMAAAQEGQPGDAGEEGEPGTQGEQGQQGEPGQPGEQQGSPTAAQVRLQQASAAQQEALDQLAQNMDQFQEGIQQANENLEHVANVMADVEQFKYLYELQKSLERSIGYYKTMADLNPDDQARLDELSAQQAEVKAQLAELKEAIRAHADALDALAEKQKGKDDVFIKK